MTRAGQSPDVPAALRLEVEVAEERSRGHKATTLARAHLPPAETTGDTGPVKIGNEVPDALRPSEERLCYNQLHNMHKCKGNQVIRRLARGKLRQS